MIISRIIRIFSNGYENRTNFCWNNFLTILQFSASVPSEDHIDLSQLPIYVPDQLIFFSRGSVLVEETLPPAGSILFLVRNNRFYSLKGDFKLRFIVKMTCLQQDIKLCSNLGMKFLTSVFSAYIKIRLSPFAYPRKQKRTSTPSNEGVKKLTWNAVRISCWSQRHVKDNWKITIKGIEFLVN